MTLNRQEVYDVWAPFGTRWASWAKPVVFAHLPESAGVVSPWAAVAESPPPWVPSPDGRAALLLDLPGSESVRLALTLARLGYRPVPLFNNVPKPNAVVLMEGLMQSLLDAVGDLQRLRLPPEAPPAFLLDGNRMGDGKVPRPGQYDNRWMVFPQDFPSAACLRGFGIEQAVVIQARSGPPAKDLTHVLRRWQEGGLAILATDLASATCPARIDVPSPALFRSAYYRVLEILKLRRNSAGGFGGIVPMPSQG